MHRIREALRKADYGALLLELVVVIIGILLALAVDRWNQNRLDRLETSRIVQRLEADTQRNLAMFETTIPDMKAVLADVKALFRALSAGSMEGEDPGRIASAITTVDVVPSYPLVFASYDELVATGRLRQLDDPTLVDLLGSQKAQYAAAQAVVGYWRDLIQRASTALDRHVDFRYTTEAMDEHGMDVRFDFDALANDRSVRNAVFEAVDVHGDWLSLQSDLHETTRQIDARLRAR